MRISCFLNKRATPNGATPRHITALRFKVAPQRCLYPSCSMYIVSLDSRRRQLAQFPPDRRLNLLRTGGSSHTGQAAPPHRNIQNGGDIEAEVYYDSESINSGEIKEPFNPKDVDRERLKME